MKSETIEITPCTDEVVLQESRPEFRDMVGPSSAKLTNIVFQQGFAQLIPNGILFTVR